MRQRLPIWFQSLAIVSLCLVWVGTIVWVEANARAMDQLTCFDRVWPRHWYSFGSYYFRNPVANIICWYLPLLIAVLGARFIWQFHERYERLTRCGRISYEIGFLVVLVLAIFIAIGAILSAEL